MSKCMYYFRSYWPKYWWQTLIVVTSVSGICLGICGFRDLNGEISLSDGLYDTFRLFLLNHQFEGAIGLKLDISRWLIFFTFLFITFKLFITIVAPAFFQQQLIHRTKDHIIICGLNETSLGFIRKCPPNPLVIIAAEKNQYTESLKQRKIHFITGDPSDPHILNIANLQHATSLYALTENDTHNLNIAHNAFSLLKQHKSTRQKPLKCYTSISDLELKNLLNDSALFKYTATDNEKFFFDGILFNTDEAGIKFSICKNIPHILPDVNRKKLYLLIIGLNDKAENILLSLAHCLTMERTSLHFTIIEKDTGKVNAFREKYPFMEDFIDLSFASDIPAQTDFSSIFVCRNNSLESVKKAVFLRYRLGQNYPAIFTFCHKPENVFTLLNLPGKDFEPLDKRNIHLINTFDEAFEYVIRLNDTIEKMAEQAHHIWRKEEKDDYKLLSEHFKQSNRNQVLDYYIKTYLWKGKTYEALRSQQIPLSITAYDQETLAMMEHRRWMIEKYLNKWQYGDQRDDYFKRRPNLKPWDDNLSSEDKEKDYKTIELMLQNLNIQNL